MRELGPEILNHSKYNGMLKKMELVFRMSPEEISGWDKKKKKNLANILFMLAQLSPLFILGYKLR